jgi:hypothetical protein
MDFEVETVINTLPPVFFSYRGLWKGVSMALGLVIHVVFLRIRMLPFQEIA